MIYIVEDDSSIRELEQYALQSNGYDARGCEDAASFWAAVRETRPEPVSYTHLGRAHDDGQYHDGQRKRTRDHAVTPVQLGDEEQHTEQALSLIHI